MLTAEKNAQLTQVGSGTPMGEVLRRHWHPFAGVDELERHPTKAVRLFGEDLVVYKDLDGNYGLLDRHCAHRRADLSYGMPEAGGLRCNYHGWQYNAEGRCVAAPFEDIADPSGRFRERLRLKAYPVRAKAGMLWAYLGPLPAPELPDWEPFSWQNGFVQVVFSEVPCNWLQAQENSIDPVHFEWMHANWTKRLRGETGSFAPTHLKLDFEEFEHGFVYKRITADTDETSPLWTIGRVCLWPNGFFLGDHFEWRVPVDDENMLSVSWFFIRLPQEREPFVQARIPSWYSPIRDANGRWITSHIINQDIVAWVGQGPITDRSLENLGASDRGIALIRRRLFEDIAAVQRGEDPKGVMRDPERNHQVLLPSDHRWFFLDGLPLAEFDREPKWEKLLYHFLFHAGQPDWVKREYEAAAGIRLRELDIINI